MTVCKFYMQGFCRYGDRCWNEHPRTQGQGFQGGGGGGGGGGRDVFTQNRFQALSNVNQNRSGGNTQNTAAAAAAKTTKDLSPQDTVNLIIEEMKIWERSKMWPFSCFSYAKEGQCLEGFEDLSPEEVRMEAYEAQKSGNAQQYQQKMSSVRNDYANKRAILSKPTQDVKQKLLQQVLTHKQSLPTSTSSGPSAFGGSSSATAAGGLFGSQGKAPNVNPFGGASTQGTSVFNQQPGNKPAGVFGGASGGSVFGGGSTAPATSAAPFASGAAGASVFGGSTASQSSVFGAAPASTSPFGGASQSGAFTAPAATAATAGATSVFGAAATSGAQSVFGSSAAGGGSVFGGSASTAGGQSTFGAGPGSVFAGSTPGFGTTPASTSASATFGTTAVFSGSSGGAFGGQAGQQATGLFGRPAVTQAGQQATGLFGQPQAAQPSAFGGGASVFGGATQPQSQAASSFSFAQPSQPKPPQQQPQQQQQQQQQQPQPGQSSSIYTPLDQLTAEEKQQFEAPKFTLGLIPMRPPPRELV